MLKKIFILSCFILGVIVNAQIILPSYQAIQYVNYDDYCVQNWSIINLNSATYSDGTLIPEVTNPAAWAALTTGAWCYYNNDPANNAVYGKLYNWYAVAGIYNAASLANPALRKKLAPTGWHIPTDDEWTTLITCLGGEMIAGVKMKEMGTTHWTSPNDATNTSGFTALPGGYREPSGAFIFIGGSGIWWSSSEYDTTYGWGRALSYVAGDVIRTTGPKKDGLSVRCLRD